MMARPKTKRDTKEVAEAVRAYAAGMPVAQIAREHGVQPPTISYWMKKWGSRFGGENFEVRLRGRHRDKEP